MMLRSQRAFAAAVLSAVAFTACGHGAGGPQGPPPLAVDVTKAQRQNIATYLSLDGQISPLQQATLSTPQSGTVTSVYANEGQRVSSGELLAKLDDSTLRAQLAQQIALASQATAQLSTQTLQGNITPSQASSTVATAAQQLATAKNNLSTAQAALVNAKLVYDGNETLYKQGYVAQTAEEASRAAYVQAQQTVNSAQAAQQQAQVALATAKAQGTNAVPIQDQAIAGARATLKSAQAQVKLLQTQIAQTSLIAPFDGVITQRLLDPGGFAGPNQPILQISQVAHVYVNINVPDNDLGFVHKATAVTFASSSVPGRTFSGTIFDVNATPSSGTLSYRARIVMPNPDDALRGGMLVSVSVRKEYHPNAIVVPIAAIVPGASGSAVYVLAPMAAKPGAPPAGPPAGAPPAAGAKPAGPPPGSPSFAYAKLVPVTLGLQTDTQAQVISPQITAGTTVITTRPDALQDKSLVAYSPNAPAGGASSSQAHAP
jgi:multidrug efflux pump subunit AcrA (membrane-fusion protein)